MRRTVLLALSLFLPGDEAAAASIQDLDAIRATKHVEAVAIDQPIHVDGVLDEPAWERATPTTDFYQQ